MLGVSVMKLIENKLEICRLGGGVIGQAKFMANALWRAIGHKSEYSSACKSGFQCASARKAGEANVSQVCHFLAIGLTLVVA